MRNGNRTRASLLAAFVAAILIAATEQTASATFSAQTLACRVAIAKAAAGYSAAVVNALSGCHKARAKSSLDSAVSYEDVDCNSVAVATGENVAEAEAKLRSVALADGQCFGVSASDALYSSCPASSTPIASFDDVTGCLIGLVRTAAQAFSERTSGVPDWPLRRRDRKCQIAISASGARVYNTVVRAVIRCQRDAERTGASTIDDCVTRAPDESLSEILAHASSRIAAKCATSDFVALDTCGTGAAAVAVCVPQQAGEDARDTAAHILQLGEPETTTTSTTTTTTVTTTTLAAGESQCPNLAEWTMLSRDSAVACASNADCPVPRTCDTGLGQCTGTTSLDLGWTGFMHRTDTNDGARMQARLHCPDGASGGDCGECTIEGIGAGAGSCRCSNDSRTICDNPFQADADCGGATCDCYLGAPLPVSAAGTPMCVVNRFEQNVTGTVDVDAGSGAVMAALRSRVYLGISLWDPCPRCDGDTSAGDGSRDGTCSAGVNAGSSCDAQAVNASFPVPWGAVHEAANGNYSLDCMPDIGKNVSGPGLNVDLNQNTGTSSLTAGIDCDGSWPGTGLCPCKVCSTDSTVACSSDSECAPQGGRCQNTHTQCSADSDCADLDLGTCGSLKRCSLAMTVHCITDADCRHRNQAPCNPSTCSANGAGSFPHPNDCEDGACNDLGAGSGECSTGPDDLTCDNALRADGSGVFPCSTNEDCPSDVIYGPQVARGPGTCTLGKRRPCFLDPIVATGTADPQFPVMASAFCVPPTASSAINTVAGLPGPGRVRQQTQLTTFCASDNSVQYTPGIGGCP